MFKKILIDTIKYLLKKIRLRVNKLSEVSTNEVSLFLKKIHPISTEHELIRVGSQNDGGYLIPNDLSDIKYCYSPGVSTNSDFEKELFYKYGIESYLCDFSVEKPPIDCEGFFFQKKYLNSYSDDVNMTLSQWLVEKKAKNEDLILQMDIEGFEYDVLSHTDLDVLKKFRIIILEVHEMDRLFSRMGFKLITSVFNKLMEQFYIVHYHANNCSPIYDFDGVTIPPTAEFTFIRKDRVKNIKGKATLPHSLDAQNVISLKDLKLSKTIFFGE